jgi:hypothetical protein
VTIRCRFGRDSYPADYSSRKPFRSVPHPRKTKAFYVFLDALIPAAQHSVFDI